MVSERGRRVVALGGRVVGRVRRERERERDGYIRVPAKGRGLPPKASETKGV